MATEYDARGNIYAVATPEEVRDLGIPLPLDAAQAARSCKDWARRAVEAFCDWKTGARKAGDKAHRTDGLLIGPFQHSQPFDLLIVNTDGTLAERSGNGLTIFSQALVDAQVGGATVRFELCVHHDKTDAPSPVVTSVEVDERDGKKGFWLNLGTPRFGAAAVGAQGPGLSQSAFRGHALHCVHGLAVINSAWNRSQFVRIGNPHCVTLLDDVRELPSNAQLQQPSLFNALASIAFSGPPGRGSGVPCAAGVNLQWAVVESHQRVAARIFERGEGPTASSGTSASAVACAAWAAGMVTTGLVDVVMPGGVAPIRLEGGDDKLQVHLFGTARRRVSEN